MSRTLYTGTRNASSWAFRAWLALKEENIEFEEVLIDIKRPQRWKNLAKIGAFSPPAAVPVLVDDNIVIFDSLAIMEYAHELGGQLLPKNIKQRAQVRSLVAWQHTGLSNVCACLSFESSFYPELKTLSNAEISSAEWVYGVWEQYLEQSGGPYLMGNYSLADIALLPSVLRLTVHHPVPNQFPKVQNWSKQLLERPWVQVWLKEAYALEPIYCPGYYGG